MDLVANVRNNDGWKIFDRFAWILSMNRWRKRPVQADVHIMNVDRGNAGWIEDHGGAE
jgi:hypothetical protein